MFIAKRLNNPELALSLIRLHLMDLNDYLNLTRPLTPQQIDQTAELILIEYPTMKIADFIYTLKCAKLGRFGKIFEGLDGMKILSWIEQVMSERADAGEHASISEHGKTKQDITGMVGNNRSTGISELKELIHKAQVMEKTGQIQRNEPLKPIK